MTWDETIRETSKRSGVPISHVRAVLDVLFDPLHGIIVADLLAGNRVRIPDFGTFERNEREYPLVEGETTAVVSVTFDVAVPLRAGMQGKGRL